MKYGLLVNENNKNIGDDIQAYAESRFLPRVDAIVDRERLDTYQLGDGTEPVALIMGAWFMWRKYNWPPSNQIVPLNVGYHHFDRMEDPVACKAYAAPIWHEHYAGVGGQWFKDHGQVGCRDMYTQRVLEEAGIPSYFSGCVTLTLPKQPETPDKDTYIVCVDLAPKVEQKVRELVGDRFEIRKTTHSTPNIKGASWEEREARVREYLTLYQNAKYVVTRRLHVALPCLAMGTPVMVIQSIRMNDPNRFEPYKKWLHYCRNTTFLKEGYPDFDFQNGTPNSTKHLKYRKKLEKTISEFVRYCEDNADKPIAFFNSPSYSEQECADWQLNLRQEALTRIRPERVALEQAVSSEKDAKTLAALEKKLDSCRLNEKTLEDLVSPQRDVPFWKRRRK